jgi:hypothetical protein
MNDPVASSGVSQKARVEEIENDTGRDECFGRSTDREVANGCLRAKFLIARLPLPPPCQHGFFLMLARCWPIVSCSGTEWHLHASRTMVLLAGRITSGRAKGVSMGSISLFNTVDNLYNTTQPTTDNTAQKTAATQPDATASQEDSVKLSTTAQAKSMYKQGQSVANIAASLGTDTKTVNNLLGITLEKAIEKTLETTLKA